MQPASYRCSRNFHQHAFQNIISMYSKRSCVERTLRINEFSKVWWVMFALKGFTKHKAVKLELSTWLPCGLILRREVTFSLQLHYKLLNVNYFQTAYLDPWLLNKLIQTVFPVGTLKRDVLAVTNRYYINQCLLVTLNLELVYLEGCSSGKISGEFSWFHLQRQSRWRWSCSKDM